MPVGDCQRAFAAAAEADGVQLGPSRLPWINQRGHFGLPPEGRVARAPLEAIFTALGGDSAAQAAKRTTPLTGDFTETSTGTLIEIDESQHFTSFRALSLRLYPSDVRVSFDRNHYMDLCRELAPRSDRYRASKAAVGFGPGGRQRQRAYHDALRDLRLQPVVVRPSSEWLCSITMAPEHTAANGIESGTSLPTAVSRGHLTPTRPISPHRSRS